MQQEPNQNSKNNNNTPGQLPWLRKAFRHYEHRGDGKISVLYLGDCLRVMGTNPNQSVVQHHIRKLQAAARQRISFEEVLGIYFSLGDNSGILDSSEAQEKAQEFISSLRFLDEKGTGFLPAKRLRHLLAGNCGERLSEKEMDDMLKDRVNDQGLVNYVDLVHSILHL